LVNCTRYIIQDLTGLFVLQMFAINVFAYYQPCRDGEASAELTQDEVRMRSYVVDLIAGSLNAYLLPVYTLKQDETLLDYFALPVSKFCH
jgi:hypothetical protein